MALQEAEGLLQDPLPLFLGLFPVAPEELQELGEGAGEVLHQGPAPPTTTRSLAPSWSSRRRGLRSLALSSSCVTPSMIPLGL